VNGQAIISRVPIRIKLALWVQEKEEEKIRGGLKPRSV